MQSKVRFPVLALAGYFKAERLVGEACEDLRGREGANGLFFTHSDHLGSSSWTTDADGRAVQHIEYLPFGEELLNQRATSYSERYTFTGKELDEESNLYYYDARYNSPTYSQFITVDPMSDKYPSVNPYLYCAGNPIKYVDPTGEVIDYTSYLPYSAQEAYKSNTDYYCESSPLLRALLTKLETSTTIFNIKVNQLRKCNGEYVPGYYNANNHDIAFRSEEIMVQTYAFAEEFFHVYQNDHPELYEGQDVNMGFEAKIFVTLLMNDITVPSYDYANTVANAILSGMKVDSREFEKLYREQCENFVKDNKSNNTGNGHYKEEKYGLPVGLISILKSINE